MFLSPYLDAYRVELVPTRPGERGSLTDTFGKNLFALGRGQLEHVHDLSIFLTARCHQPPLIEASCKRA